MKKDLKDPLRCGERGFFVKTSFCYKKNMLCSVAEVKDCALTEAGVGSAVLATTLASSVLSRKKNLPLRAKKVCF